jgi:hypothetical protein
LNFSLALSPPARFLSLSGLPYSPKGLTEIPYFSAKPGQ